jgi:hypothetical protein
MNVRREIQEFSNASNGVMSALRGCSLSRIEEDILSTTLTKLRTALNRNQAKGNAPRV